MKFSRKKLLITVLITFIMATYVHSQDIIGSLVYTQGRVEVVRSGRVLSGRTVFNGMPIQNFDQLKVPRGGLAEVKVDPKTGIDATVKVQSNSTVTFDITSLRSSQRGNLELIGGNIELKVSRLTTGNGLNVKTGSATMGVRGTTFSVTVSPTGDTLLATDEGRVVCITASGNEFFSEPGNIVEGTNEGVWGNQSVPPEGLSEFRQTWFAQRVEAFSANPSQAFIQQANLWEKAFTDFNAAYAELNAKRDVINRWIRQDQAGNIGSTMERNRDKIALITPLRKLRMAQDVLERSNLRLQQIDELLQGRAITGNLRSGTTGQAFARTWRNAQSQLSTRLAEVWYVTRMYAARNEGSFPLDAVGSGMADPDSFFGTTDF